MKLKDGFALLKEAISEFNKDDALTLGAALAFYTALSFAPLLVLLMWAAGSLGVSTQQEVVSQVMGLVGHEAGEAVKTVAESAKDTPSIGNFAGFISLAALLFSATGVFAQLQHAMNLVWNVESKPGNGIISFVRTRLLSLGMLVTIAFLLLVSLVVSAGLSAAIAMVGDKLPGADFLWRLLDLGASLLIFTMIFGAIFKVLPDVQISWRHVGLGAFLTSVMFTIGKTLIGLYLGRSSMASAYGAAGSLLVLLSWVYYSSLILFFGAELTQVWAKRHGRVIEPSKHAVPRGQQDAQTVASS